MKKRILLKEAVENAKESGKKVNIGDLACKIFPGKSPESSYMVFNYYINGKRLKIDRDTVEVICKELDIDANELFGIKSKSDELIQKQKAIINRYFRMTGVNLE